DNPTVEAALRLDAAVADKLENLFDAATADKVRVLAANPTDADVAAILRGVDDIRPKPWPAWFKEWQARGGPPEIDQTRLAQQDVIPARPGALPPTPPAHPAGHPQA